MKVAIIDYGVGNLGSVRRALALLDADAFIASAPDELAVAERIILPGVGSFSDGMARLAAQGWSEEILRQVNQSAKPLLGLCLGMQLLASRGREGGDTPGLGLVPGEVVRLDSIGCRLRIPHVGWNAISLCAGEHGLLAGIPEGADFYFVHSYAFVPTESRQVRATTDYGVPVVAAVGAGRVSGTQFHPEKSSKAGLRLLKNFLEAGSC